MGKTSWQVKKKYNGKVYKRIAVDLDKELVDEFKAKCKAEDVPQAEVIRDLIKTWLADRPE